MRLILLPLALLLFGLSACSRSIVTIPPAGCAKLIPSAWADGVEGAALPAGDAVSDWQKAFVAQSGQLSKANGRTGDVIAIFAGCEAMVNAARPK